MNNNRKNQKCLVIIPAYNEGKRIGPIVNTVQSLNLVDEILVVDDCSIDDTAEVARKAGATVISLVANLGYGAALQTGYKYSYENDFDITVQMDGDGQHDPNYIENLIRTLRNTDCNVVIGSRFLGHLRSYKAPMVRKIGMRFFRFLIYIFIKKNITDPTSGYQALDRDVIKLFARGNLYPSDYPDADIIILLNNVGFKIAEIPVIMYEDDSGKSMHSGVRPLFYVVKMFLSIFTVLFGQHRTFLRRTQKCLSKQE